MSTKNPFKPGTAEYSSQKNFLAGLKDFEKCLHYRKTALCACIPAVDALMKVAKANQGKKLGPVMIDKLINAFQDRAALELASLEDYSLPRVSLYWLRPYDFMNSPEFSIDFFNSERKRLGSWEPKLNGAPYENSINDSFLACIEDMKGTLVKYLTEIDEYFHTAKSESSKLITEHINLLKSTQDISEHLKESFRVGGASLGNVVSPYQLFSYRNN